MDRNNPAILAGTTLLLVTAGCIGGIGDGGSLDPQFEEILDGSGGAGMTTSTGQGTGNADTSLGGTHGTGGQSAGGSGGTPTGTGGAGAGSTGGSPPTPVDCSGIDQHPAFELCDSGPDYCSGVYTNGAGCAAYCAAAGMVCEAAYGGEPGCQKEAIQLSCAVSGHQSDWCVCGPGSGSGGGGPGPTCATDPQHPPAQVDQHYSQATFNPRSSWVLQCQSYAYTAQFAEHEACDSLYQAGSGRGTATFLLNVNPGSYDVYVEGRHTINRNPAGMRVEVNSGGNSHVAHIMQRDDSGQILMDLHGTYCLSGTVEIVVDSSMSGQSDSVSRVRVMPN